MQTFLSQVAGHYANSPDKLRRMVFILPNRRSALHLKEQMNELVNAGAAVEGQLRKRIGTYISINDFLQKVYGVDTSDRIKLILTLYACYRELNPKAEPLDEFIHWGRVMIADFDNLDKYLVDAKKLFVNVSDFRAIQDTYQYLTDGQRSAIEHFLRHFRNDAGRVTVNMDADSESVKARFLQIWNLLGPLYGRFNERLEQSDMAYEGRVYRMVAQQLVDGTDVKTLTDSAYPWAGRFVFVGLNALNECEKVILRSLRNAGLAEFCWDFSSRELKDGRNKASLFLKKNVEEFPQAFPLDQADPLRRPEVNVVSVPSGVGQTKLAPQILASVSGCKSEETVFVLPDETLLMPLLSAIPAEYDTVNITMGYPMDRSSVYGLMKAVGRLQQTMRIKDGVNHFHYKAVRDILSNSLLNAVLTQEESATVQRAARETRQFIPMKELHGTPLMDVIFAPIMTASGSRQVSFSLASAEQNHAIEASYLILLDLLKTRLLDKKRQEGEAFSSHLDMELDFLERYRQIVLSFRDTDLPVLPGTWMRLLDGLLRSESVPFEGDALKGLQVMGTLETRALDFKNVVILSCNEDLFPHRSADNSFIPPELRRGFGMPTLEYQDAVWAYYFYRLIQRAEKVWLVYDNRTEGLLSGEESRYIKQLEYHFRFPLKRFTAVSPVAPTAEDPAIEKTADDIAFLKDEGGRLSASSLQSYLDCPAKFYYQAVKRLRTEDDVKETMDASTLGTVFHAVMEALYKDKRMVSLQDIRAMLTDVTTLKAIIREAILSETQTLEIEGRNIIIADVVLQYVKATLRHDADLLLQSGSDSFRIIGLERKFVSKIDGFSFIGFADRIDSFRNGEVRIVDYKTGKVEDDDILISDSNAQSVVEKLFGDNPSGRPKIALQMYLYGRFAHDGLLHPGEKLVNSIYSTARLMRKPLPDVPESPVFTQMVDERLHGILAEIADTSTPWKRTCDKHVCEKCDFRSICGR